MEIIKILENKTLKLKNFILQPMRDTAKLREYLKIEKPTWEQIQVETGTSLEEIKPLFERINIPKQ